MPQTISPYWLRASAGLEAGRNEVAVAASADLERGHLLGQDVADLRRRERNHPVCEPPGSGGQRVHPRKPGFRRREPGCRSRVLKCVGPVRHREDVERLHPVRQRQVLIEVDLDPVDVAPRVQSRGLQLKLHCLPRNRRQAAEVDVVALGRPPQRRVRSVPIGQIDARPVFKGLLRYRHDHTLQSSVCDIPASESGVDDA